ncbi:hypothetical protein UlMin_015097, partial [Ulmus minor]
SHGDGHPSNTDTPLVVWGAGVEYPKPISSSNHSYCGVTVLLMNTCMTHLNLQNGAYTSVGSLPLEYVNFDKAAEVEAVVANTKQILNQFLQKS